MKRLLAFLLGLCVVSAQAQPVVDLASRPGVTERMLVLAPAQPTATVILLTGGAGYVVIRDDGEVPRAENFLVRTRELFLQQGFAVLVLDAASDRPRPVFLGNAFRDSTEHMQDLGAAVQWARQKFGKPVWLVGTSRGTQSAAHAAEALTGPAAPDGIVLTSTILARSPRGGEGRSVPEMDLARIAVPVLVVHHEQDACKLCPYWQTARLLRNLTSAQAKELITVTGGEDHGDPCQPMAHHGFNGQEADVVARIAAWITSH